MAKDALLITGAGGFIGQALVEYLDGASLRPYVALGRQGVLQCSSHFADFKPKPGMNADDLISLVIAEMQPKVIVNLAASRHLLDVNLEGKIDQNESFLRTLVQTMQSQLSSGRLIHFGSADEYGLAPRPYLESASELPVTDYGKSKVRCTDWLRQESVGSDFDFIVLRPSSVYGPNQTSDMFIPSVINAIRTRTHLALTSGQQHRDFLYLDDLVAGVMAASRYVMPTNFEVFNLASGTTHSLISALNMIREFESNIEADDLFTFDKPQRQDEIFDLSLATQKARLELNWKAKIDLPTGLRMVLSS